jgi:hypothetical protein
LLTAHLAEQAGLFVTGVLATASEATGSNDPFQLLLQYGVLGLVVIGFATGWIVPGVQAKALDAENKRLTAVIEGKLFPMLESYGASQDKANTALTKATDAMEKSAQAMDRFTRLQDRS